MTSLLVVSDQAAEPLARLLPADLWQTVGAETGTLQRRMSQTALWYVRGKRCSAWHLTTPGPTLCCCSGERWCFFCNQKCVGAEAQLAHFMMNHVFMFKEGTQVPRGL